MRIARPTTYNARPVTVTQGHLILLLHFVLCAGAVLVVVLLSDAQSAERYVVLPALALVIIALSFVATLWKRDGSLPVFELGTICVVTTAFYSLVPLLNFMAGGMSWTILSDSRLQVYNPTPEEVGAFAWRHVIYLLSLVVAYLFVRANASVRRANLEMVDRTTITMMVFLFLASVVYFQFLESWFNVSLSATYKEFLVGVQTSTELPYFLQQIYHNVWGIKFILKLSFLVFLLQRWQSKKWRYVLVAWLLGEVLFSVLRLGSRTEVVLLLLGTALLYHRLVKPLKLWVVVLAGFVLLNGVLLWGIVRDVSGGLGKVSEMGVSLWSVTNEFQALFGTAYDLYERKNMGALDNIPWQVYAGDLLMLVPSQLLPFDKWNPSEWYLWLIGARGTGVGFMFGAISQAIIGLDWAELIIRGTLLGCIFALVHRWYVRRSSEFWATLLYLFLCLFSYYTFRGSTFYIVYFVLYQFVPTMMLVRLGSTVLRGASQSVVPRGP